MIAYAIDAILLAALLFTSLRVGIMYRELKRLRGCRSDYVGIVDDTNRAVIDIGAVVQKINCEGLHVVRDLGGRIDEAQAVIARLQGLVAAARIQADLGVAHLGTHDDLGLYSRGGTTEAEAGRREWSEAGARGFAMQAVRQPGRDFRMAPSVKTLRAVGGAGS